jgi:hypothetical protein
LFLPFIFESQDNSFGNVSLPLFLYESPSAGNASEENRKYLIPHVGFNIPGF